MFERILGIILVCCFICILSLSYYSVYDLFSLWKIEQDIVSWERTDNYSIDNDVALHLDHVLNIQRNTLIQARLRHVEIKLLEWLAVSQRLSPETQTKTFKKIMNLIKTHLVEMPESAKYWAMFTYYYGHTSSNWTNTENKLFEKTLNLGKWDGGVQYYLILSILNRWEHLPTIFRQQLLSYCVEVYERAGSMNRLFTDFKRKNPKHNFNQLFEHQLRVHKP